LSQNIVIILTICPNIYKYNALIILFFFIYQIIEKFSY